MTFNADLDFAPWRLSGVVYGTLLNDPQALALLGQQCTQPPYKAPPQAPVLYLKPRNTLAGEGSVVLAPDQTTPVRIGASLGIIIGATACRVPEAAALEVVAGYAVVNDVCLPHENFYRPSLRFNARDGFCPIGPRRRAAEVPDPDALQVRTYVDGVLVHDTSTAGLCRPLRRLIADVTAFMTLQAGDLLLLGVRAGAPLVLPSASRTRVEITGIGALNNQIGVEECAT